MLSSKNSHFAPPSTKIDYTGTSTRQREKEKGIDGEVRQREDMNLAKSVEDEDPVVDGGGGETAGDDRAGEERRSRLHARVFVAFTSPFCKGWGIRTEQ